jgi:hypothetical protein
MPSEDRSSFIGPFIQQLIIINIHLDVRKQLTCNGRRPAFIYAADEGWVILARKHCVDNLVVLKLGIKALRHVAEVCSRNLDLASHELFVYNFQRLEFCFSQEVPANDVAIPLVTLFGSRREDVFITLDDSIRCIPAPANASQRKVRLYPRFPCSLLNK